MNGINGTKSPTEHGGFFSTRSRPFERLDRVFARSRVRGLFTNGVGLADIQRAYPTSNRNDCVTAIMITVGGSQTNKILFFFCLSRSSVKNGNIRNWRRDRVGTRITRQ